MSTVISMFLSSLVCFIRCRGKLIDYQIQVVNNALILKVGRSIDPRRRQKEWSRQCKIGSTLRLCIPEYPNEEPSSLSHRMERLALLELRDLALSTQAWSVRMGNSGVSLSSPKNLSHKTHEKARCKGCGCHWVSFRCTQMLTCPDRW
jgi:hypothetical protein